MLLVNLRQYATAGAAAKPEYCEALEAHQAGLIGQQQATSLTGLAVDAQVGPHSEEAVTTAEITDTATEEAVPTAGAADTSTDNAVSTAGAADAAAASEGTPEPPQVSSPPAETNNNAKATPPTADTITADTAPQADEASVANASSLDEDQKDCAVDATPAAPDAAADRVAASAAAASSDGTIGAAGAPTDQVAISEVDAASQGSASAAAVAMFESHHTPMDGAPSGAQRDPPDQLSSIHAFAAAQYATGNARHNCGMQMTRSWVLCCIPGGADMLPMSRTDVISKP